MKNICPVCNSSNWKEGPTIQDYFLSQEQFPQSVCLDCGVQKTWPMPAEDEIGKYYESEDYLSHGDDQKGLFAKLYRLAKGYNLGWKGRTISSLIKQGRFLDYGCGTADLIAHCDALGMHVRGAEPSAQAIEHAPQSMRSKIVSPKEELASDRSYDLISMWHVLEHIHEPKEVLSQLINKLDSGGFLLIALPNPQSDDAKHYGEKWAAWDVPRHLWHYEPKQVIQMLAGLNMNHINSHPMWFDSFYVSLLSEKYKKGSALKGILRGLVSNFKALSNKKEKCSSQVYVFRKN